MAAVLAGTQVMAEDTGVTSASNMTDPATSVMNAEQDLPQEVDQVEMLQQVIRDVELRLLNENKTEGAEADSELTAAQKNAPLSDKTVNAATESISVLSDTSVGSTHGKEMPTEAADGESSSSGLLSEKPVLQYQPAMSGVASRASDSIGEVAGSTSGSPTGANDKQLESIKPFESGFIQEFPNGTVNWLTGVVTASGESIASGLAVSRQQAERKTMRAATVDARRNLLEILSKIPVNEDLRVRNILRKDESVMKFVRGDMQNSRIVSTEFSEEGIAVVRVSITLRDLFLEKLIGKHIAFHHSLNNPYSAANAVAESIKGAVSTPDSDGAGDGFEEPALTAVYTGLLIDARDTGVQPAITVNVVDEAGNIVYSPRTVNRDAALKYGMAEYVGNLEEALASKRASTNPLVLKAVSYQGRARSNIVISDEQARLLEQINNGQNFLEQGRVVIVCN